MGDEGANAYAPSMTSQSESQTNLQNRDHLGSSSTTSGYVKRRKKKPNFSQLQTIQIERASSGFGFLLAGNSPCYLSEVISGTPAEKAGLLPGQYIMTINGENASTWRVDKVVEYIMNSGNRLLLNVAMDDHEKVEEREDHQGVTLAKPPLKPMSLQRSHNIKYGPGSTPRSIPSSWSNIANIEVPVNERLSSKVFGSYVSSDALGSCNSVPSNRGSSLSSSNEQYPTPMTSANSELNELGSIYSLDCQRASTCSSTSTAKSSQAESVNIPPQRMSTSGKSSFDSELFDSQTSSKSSLRHLNNSSDIFSAAASGNFYSVVGFVRSIDIPSQTKDQISTMATLLNSVKKHDRKINFVLLLEVSDSAIRLINAKKSTVTSINITSVISCIPLSEDKKFFGILARRPSEGESINGPVTCMVLAIDPQIAHHEVHVKAAKKFTLACTRITSTLCKEFPVECGAIIAKIQSKLPNPSASAFDAIGSRSLSSNSDSGIATCKDKLGKAAIGHMHTARAPHHAAGFREKNVPAGASNVNHWFENRNPRPLSELNPPRYNNPTNSNEATSSQHVDGHYVQRRSEHRPSSVYQPTAMSHPSNNPFSQNFSAHSNFPMQPPAISIKSPPLGTSERIRPMSGLNQINSWAANFDNLLIDPKGVAIFTEFLKKEFAEENIIFYQLCQDFKALFDYHEMRELAMKIYHQHLASNCPHPVNLDSQVLQSVYEKLESNLISRDIFDEAFLQIYKLMKFDPYSRFLKSELYSECVKNSVCSPNGDPCLKDEKRANFSLGSSDAASDDSNCQAENKKGPFLKKSLLPWKKKCKPRNDSTDSSVKSLEKTRGLSQSSDSVLLSVPSHSSIEASTQCKVYLPNGCHVVVECDQSKTVESTVMTLCMEYNLNQRCLNVVDSEHRAIDLAEILNKFAGREIYLERTIYFRLQLPSNQTIGVKSIPNKSIRSVFQPLLVRYRLSINNLIIRLEDSTTPLDLQLAVAALDSQKVIADTIEQYNELALGKENAQTQSVPLVQVKQEPQISSGLVTRKPRRQLPEPMKQEFKTSILPRPSNEEHQIGSSRHETDGVSHRYETSGMISNQTDFNTEQGQFIGLLAKVQGDRLDNQRGIMSLSKLEMPTFLEPNVEPVHNHSTPEKWHDCCYSSSCMHLNSEGLDQWQSTMIHPQVTKPRQQDGRPPTGRHRKVVYPGGNTSWYLSNHPSDSLYNSMSNLKHLSREITPIPGSNDQYYNLSSPDVSSVDIYPSQLPSPSTFGVYPLTAPASPSNNAPPHEAEFSSIPSYLPTPVEPEKLSPRKPSQGHTTILKSNSAEWSPNPNGSLIENYHGNQKSSFGSESESRTHGSTLSSASKPDSNLHYPSAASSESMASVNNDIRAYFHEQSEEVPHEIGNVQVYHV